ncbi:MAG: sigma 54-interacting transcriptional regulator [Clostridiales Family XIII bacterium]|jgi:transcriptional regulator with PAS, ATPase and Fis domain|nr:sigma 54-interacting transcriptional regulator [Clostridiales Family XIII bacterium]
MGYGDKNTAFSGLKNGLVLPEGIAAGSKAMCSLVKKAIRVAPSGATVLLTGESGTGKELFASLIHRCSGRTEAPFVKINCAAVPENLIESEFFGYEKGSFTGADQGGKAGIFEQAGCGTLFLDEIGDLPIHLQSKLLNVLQDKKVRRIGGHSVSDVGFRLIAATNQDLDRAVREGRFRADLFYLLNILPIEIPPLRNRPVDVVLLSEHFTQVIGASYGIRKTLSKDAQNALLRHDWPGNARELRNIMERALISFEEEEITAQQIFEMLQDAQTLRLPFLEEDASLQTLMDAYEKKIVTYMMKKYKTAGAVCTRLKISKATMSRKLRKHEIKPCGCPAAKKDHLFE